MHQLPSSTALKVEALLEGSGSNLDDFLREESIRAVEAKGLTPSSYDVFAVRRNDQTGSEVFGPKLLHVGTYSEEALYGAAGSPLVRFRAAIQALKAHADKISSLDHQQVEYGHQTALF